MSDPTATTTSSSRLIGPHRGLDESNTIRESGDRSPVGSTCSSPPRVVATLDFDVFADNDFQRRVQFGTFSEDADLAIIAAHGTLDTEAAAVDWCLLESSACGCSSNRQPRVSRRQRPR